MSNDGTGRPDNTEPRPLGANLSDDQIATLTSSGLACRLLLTPRRCREAPL